jgi:hypothetical protein
MCLQKICSAIFDIFFTLFFYKEDGGQTMNAKINTLSYLLRIWRVSDFGCDLWRASLEKIGSGETQGFPSIDALFAFLQQETQTNNDKPPAEVAN